MLIHLRRFLLSLNAWMAAMALLPCPAARAAQPGQLDPAFAIAEVTNSDLGMDCVVTQANGGVLVGGRAFRSPNSGLGRGSLIRIRSDGTLDPVFNPTITGGAQMVRETADGRILVAGELRRDLASDPEMVLRLLSSGHIDPAFELGRATNGVARALHVQRDGRVLLGGSFRFVGGLQRSNLARLNSDGTVDLSFDPGQGFRSVRFNGGASFIYDIEVDEQDRVLVAGVFELADGVPRNGVARLLPDGRVDETFVPILEDGCNVRSMRLQTDGRILLGGVLRYHGRTAAMLRLNPDGSLDPSFADGTGFHPDEANINELLVQPDGRILVASHIRSFGSTPGYLLRLRSDGSLDPEFGLGDSNVVDGAVHSIALQANGGILAVGFFETAQGSVRSGIARIQGGTPLPQPPWSVSAPQFLTTANGASIQLVSRLAGHPAPDLQWIHNGAPINGQTSALLSLENLSPATGGDYSVRASNNSGVLTTRVAIVQVARQEVGAGSSDLSFIPPAQPGVIHALLEQPGCGIVAAADGGLFRLTPEGSHDPTFEPQFGGSRRFHALAVDAMGRLLVAGVFSVISGTPRNAVARLQSDGRLDESFAPPSDSTGYGVAVAVDEAGRVLVARMTQNLASLFRLMPDGSPDPEFTAVTNVAGVFNVVLPRSGGRILVAGSFSNISGHSVSNIALLGPGGEPDSSFHVGTDGEVATAAILPDGRIAWGGRFTRFNGEERSWLPVTDGEFVTDDSFARGSAQHPIKHLTIASGGGLLACNILTLAGVAQGQPPISRFMSDGRLDTSFSGGRPFAGKGVNAGLLSTCGDWIIGGDFSLVGGVQRRSLSRVRLNPLMPAPPSIRTQPESVTQPYGRRVRIGVTAVGHPLSFQWYEDGQAIPGADLDNLEISDWDPLRIRQFHATVSNSLGMLTTTAATVTSLGDPPVINLQPRSQEVAEGQGVALLSGLSRGTPKPGLRWQRNGVDLPHQTNISLYFPEFRESDAGSYRLIASNSGGTVTSSVARVEVLPAIDINTAVNTTHWLWTSSADAPWLPDALVSWDQMASAGSGVLPEWLERSSLRTRLFGPGDLKFRWRVSSRTNTHYLVLQLNGAQRLSLSGEVDWRQATTRLSSGPVDVMWTYFKRSADVAGSDRGWVDEVSYTPINPQPPSILEQPGPQSLLSGLPVRMSVYAQGVGPLRYQWHRDGEVLPDATGAVFRIVASSKSDAGSYTVAVSNAFGGVISAAVMLEIQDRPPQLGSPTWIGAGRLRFQLLGTAGTRYRIEHSENLVDWSLLSETLVQTDHAWIEDLVPEELPARFYRARVEP